MKLMYISIASNSTLHNSKLQIQVRPNDYLTEPCTQALIDLVKMLKSIYEGAENLYGAYFETHHDTSLDYVGRMRIIPIITTSNEQRHLNSLGLVLP
jgi:hypothetical protein